MGCWKPEKFTREYTSVDEVRSILEGELDIDEISFTTNEAMLNPAFPEIIQLCRDFFPNARLWVITNAMIAISGRFAHAISLLDKISLSIDGATKGTFETIRVGSNFDRFVSNVSKIVDIAKENGRPSEITFGFTATATNLHELADVIRLGKKLGVSNVWAQPMEIKSKAIEDAISTIHIDCLDSTLRRELVDYAVAVAANEGMPLFFSEGLYPVSATQVSLRTWKDSNTFDDSFVRKCQYPWREPVQLVKYGNRNVALPCCYMLSDEEELRTLAQEFNLSFDMVASASEIYNSPEMWDFREALLDGKTARLCGNCDAARAYQP